MTAEAVIDKGRFAQAWAAGDMRTLEFGLGLFRRWKP
jgi:hypothetical protein